MVHWGPNSFKLFLACQTEFDLQYTKVECSPSKPPQYLQACNRNLPNIGRCCMQNKQLLTNSPLKLKYNSNIFLYINTWGPLPNTIFWIGHTHGWSEKMTLIEKVPQFPYEQVKLYCPPREVRIFETEMLIHPLEVHLNSMPSPASHTHLQSTNCMCNIPQHTMFLPWGTPEIRITFPHSQH